MLEQDDWRYKGMRKKLVDSLRIKGISDEAVLVAIEKVPRHLFMDSSFVNFAYKDQAFPIAAGQTISQPYTVAFQTSLLKIQKSDKVLEIGTGSGYQTAILLELKAKVYTIERQKELFDKTKAKLMELGYYAATFLGDGYNGLPDFAPFDKILITAGAQKIPENLKKQLKIGGKMVVPVGENNQQEMLLVEKKDEENYTITKHGGFKFVPMLKGIVNF